MDGQTHILLNLVSSSLSAKYTAVTNARLATGLPIGAPWIKSFKERHLSCDVFSPNTKLTASIKLDLPNRCTDEKSKIPFSYMLYAYSVKEPIGELYLKRALDEDTGVFSSFTKHNTRYTRTQYHNNGTTIRMWRMFTGISYERGEVRN